MSATAPFFPPPPLGRDESDQTRSSHSTNDSYDEWMVKIEQNQRKIAPAQLEHSERMKEMVDTYGYEGLQELILYHQRIQEARDGICPTPPACCENEADCFYALQLMHHIFDEPDGTLTRATRFSKRMVKGTKYLKLCSENQRMVLDAQEGGDEASMLAEAQSADFVAEFEDLSDTFDDVEDAVNIATGGVKRRAPSSLASNYNAAKRLALPPIDEEENNNNEQWTEEPCHSLVENFMGTEGFDFVLCHQAAEQAIAENPGTSPGDLVDPATQIYIDMLSMGQF